MWRRLFERIWFAINLSPEFFLNLSLSLWQDDAFEAGYSVGNFIPYPLEREWQELRYFFPSFRQFWPVDFPSWKSVRGGARRYVVIQDTLFDAPDFRYCDQLLCFDNTGHTMIEDFSAV